MTRRHHYWIETECDYTAMRAIVGNNFEFAGDYAAWTKDVTKKIAKLESCGWSVERVAIGPKEFIRYCDKMGLKAIS